MAGKTANAYVKIIVSSNIKKAMNDFKAAHPKLAAFGSAMKKAGLVGAAGLAAAVAAFWLLKKALTACLREYEEYMLGLVKVQRFTGLNARATSRLAGQLRLSGVAVDKGTTGLRFFAKNLDAARQGQTGMSEAFERLNVDLVDASGKTRDLDTVLTEVRDRFSEMEDPAERTALAVKLFGKGGADMLPWLTKSTAKMAEFTKFLRETGLIMSEQTMKAFGEYRENQRKLSLAWDAIKVSAAAALVPLINKLLPHVTAAIQTAAGWMGKFRRRVEKKGLEAAIHEMVPELEEVWDLLKEAWRSAKKFGAYIVDHKDEIVAAFNAILAVVNAIASTLNAIIAAMKWIQGNNDILNGNFSAGGGGGSGGGGGVRAEGGIVTSPEVSLIGEAGAEAIIPLTKPARAAEVLAEAGLLGGQTIVQVFIGNEQIEPKVTKMQRVRAKRLARGYA